MLPADPVLPSWLQTLGRGAWLLVAILVQGLVAGLGSVTVLIVGIVTGLFILLGALLLGVPLAAPVTAVTLRTVNVLRETDAAPRPTAVPVTWTSWPQARAG
jgi:hypothetical protein